MKVELNKQGLFVLTAETKQDNMVLFSITNNDTITGIQLRYSDSPVSVPVHDHTKKSGRGIYDRSKMKRKVSPYRKDCPVEGCGEKVKGIRVHMHKRHGIYADGSIHETFEFGGENKPVKKPAVKLPDGTYRVRPVPSLLD
jgi:hypothetical protein